MVAVKIADYIEAPNSGGNYRKVLLVVHVTVSPEVNGAARGVVAYWNRHENGSTQYVVDNAEIIQSVRETAYAWSAGKTANRWGIHVEHCGYIQTVRQWKDGYSTAQLELSAPLFAELGAKHGIPLRRIGPAQIRKAVASGNPADGGICGHDDITAAFPGETTHSDPGRYFPWDRFMRLIQAAATDSPEEDDDMTPDQIRNAPITVKRGKDDTPTEVTLENVLADLESTQEQIRKDLRVILAAITKEKP